MSRVLVARLWSTVVYSPVGVMSEAIDKTHTQRGCTYNGKPPHQTDHTICQTIQPIGLGPRLHQVILVQAFEF